MTLLGHDAGPASTPDERGWELVWRACQGRAIEVSPGAWELPARAGSRDDLVGWAVIEGLICREVALRDRHMLELLGPGDVVLPTGVPDPPELGEPPRLTATVQTTLMVLGLPFIRAAARWPTVLAVVNRRLESQRQRLAIQAVIAHVPRAEHRLLLQMWHLAGRWGRTTSEGTVLTLPLTHDLLGQLAAARRSTSTLALSALESEGIIRRLDDGCWLLTPVAQRRVAALSRTGKTGRVLGETLQLRQRMLDAREESQALRAEAEQLLIGREKSSRRH
jgi:CRP-like cAMP-binding protein